MNKISVTVVLTSSLLATSAVVAHGGETIGILLAAGDVARCGDKPKHLGDEATAALIGDEIKQAKSRNLPVVVLAPGDLAYDTGSTKDFKCFDNSWGAVLREQFGSDYQKHILVVPGNHEYQQVAAKDFFTYFSKSLANAGATKEGYFFLDFPSGSSPGWRIMGLNSNLKDSGMAAQVTALEDDLRAHPEQCVLAFWHHPVFSSGLHGHGDCKSDDKVCKKERSGEHPTVDFCKPNDSRQGICAGTQKMLSAYKTLYDFGASIVVTGHDHHYEQLGRRNPEGDKSGDGVREFVVGTGGGHLYTQDYTKKWDYEDYRAGNFGVLKIELLPTSYKWKFLPTRGTGAPESEDHCNTRRIP